MYTIAVSRWIRYASAALLSLGALLIRTAEVWAVPLPSGCWMAIGTTGRHGDEAAHGWQPRLIRRCATALGMTESVGWDAPLSLDGSEAENEVRHGPPTRGVPARTGQAPGGNGPFPTGIGILPARAGWRPGIGYVNLG